MENRPIGPEEQDDTNDSTRSKKKRGSTLSRYLSALRGKEASADNPEDAGAEKPKRAQRLLSRLFPGIVERPAHLSPEETSSQEHEFNHEAWFGWVRHARQGERTRSSSEQAEDISESGSDSTPPQAKAGVKERPRVVERLDSAQAVVPEVTEAALPDHDTALPRPVSEQVLAPQSHELNEPTAAEFAVLPRQQGEIPLRTATGTETIIERRGSNLLPVALVGAEYIGRKRAGRKLEARVDRKIEASNEKQQRSAALQKELEQVVSQNKQQIEQLKRARVAMERQVSQVSERKEVASIALPAVEARTVSQPEVPRIEQKPFIEEAIKPQNIAERVADAAEHDVPVERAFERSHEVKDDIPMATTAASVGTVIAANIAAAGLAPGSRPNNTQPSSTAGLPFVSDADIAASYKQAAKMGFWTAICLIVLGVIAYLMVRYI